MFEILGEHRPTHQVRCRDEGNPRGAIKAANAARLPLQNAPLPDWAMLEAPLTRWVPHRSEALQNTLLTVMRGFSAAIRAARRRARSRQQLHRFSDHMLRDIGLSRDQVGYEIPGPIGRLR